VASLIQWLVDFCRTWWNNWHRQRDISITFGWCTGLFPRLGHSSINRWNQLPFNIVGV